MIVPLGLATLPTPLQLWFLALWVAWAALLGGGFLLGSYDPVAERRLATWPRIGSSILLVAAAWSWAWVLHEGPTAVYGILIGTGMTLGLLGDLLLARLVPGVVRPVLPGMATFGVGHLAYIAALSQLIQSRMALAIPWLPWLCWLLVGLLGWYLAVGRGHSPTGLQGAALIYALLLASTAGIASGLALQHPSLIGLAAGAILFLISDLILAANLFGGFRFPLIHDLVWLTYGPAQMLIVYSSGVLHSGLGQ